MNRDIDFEVIWKKINNQVSKEEEALLNEWLSQSHLHRRYFKNALHYYTNGTQFSSSPAELRKALKKILRKANIYTPYVNTRRIIAITSVAASILFFLYFQFGPKNNLKPTPEQIVSAPARQSIASGTRKAILVLADGSEHDLCSTSTIIDADGTEIKNTGNKLEYTNLSNQPVSAKYNTLKIPRGGEYFLILADGTKVWLNSETTLRYPVQFEADERNVELSGEAFFEVTRNEKVPFVVISGNQSVKVLGTRFNVSSYADNPNTYTTLVEGKVEVSSLNNPVNKLTLHPNEQSIIGQNDDQIQKRTVDVSQYVAWKDGRFIFDDQRLEEIMNTLSKWYNIQVEFANPKNKEIRFTGNLERYADFSSILKRIEKTEEVKFEIENNIITIK